MMGRSGRPCHLREGEGERGAGHEWKGDMAGSPVASVINLYTTAVVTLGDEG
jgi:hypothetical protein